MKNIPLSAAAIRVLLQTRNLALKKRWGQNFLISPPTYQRIVQTIAHIAAEYQSPGPDIWEIGPGLGVLTVPLRAIAHRLTLFEIDHGLIRYLKETIPEIVCHYDVAAHGIETNNEREAHIALYPGDALQVMPILWKQGANPNLIVGNLPYRSAAALLLSCAQSLRPPSRLAVLLQREIADRICSQPNSRDWSSLSVAMQATYDIQQVLNISRNSFFPIPHVDSVFVIARRHGHYGDFPRVELETITRAAFAARRATLRNNLRRTALLNPLTRTQLLASDVLHRIDPQRRAETLSVQEFIDIACWLRGHNSNLPHFKDAKIGTE